jgi:hypothetical protein
VGPASPYPTFRTPASICLSEPNEVSVPGLTAGRLAGSAASDCAIHRPSQTERNDGKGHGRSAKKETTVVLELFERWCIRFV